MQLRLLDILADPDNPDHWPLKLEIFESEIRERKTNPQPHENGLLCKFYCYKEDAYLVSDPLGDNETSLPLEQLQLITTLEHCYDCIKSEIIDGILYHNKEDELKWFIIDREIPVMFPMELRDRKQERKFISIYNEECGKLNISKPELED